METLVSEPQSKITETDIQQYEKDGVVCLRGMFDPGWIEYMRKAIEKAKDKPGPLAQVYTKEDEPGHSWGDHAVWERIPEFRDFVFNSPGPAIAAKLTRSPCINLFYDHLIVKEPGTVQRTPWHQDQPYWAVKGRQLITIWTPFDVVPQQNALEVIRGSHNGKTYNPFNFTTKEPFKGTNFEPMPDVEAHRGLFDIVSFDLNPGDCLVIHAMMVHGAPGNMESEHRRRVLITHWAGEDARHSQRAGELAINARDPGLGEGDTLDGCPLYPKVWPRSSSN